MLEVRGLQSGFGAQQVLHGVDLVVAEGDVVALLGPNGAGKTTLLRTIAGTHPAWRGTIHHRGVDITASGAPARVERGIVLVPGGRAVFPNLSVFDNLVTGCHLFAWDTARVRRRIEASLALFPRLDERLDQRAGSLSGGEQQMLALAKGLLGEPTLLLVDELSLGLAPVVVKELVSVVERLRTAGTTMVIVEQSLTTAAGFARRAAWLEKGSITSDGPLAAA